MTITTYIFAGASSRIAIETAKQLKELGHNIIVDGGMNHLKI